MNAKNCAVALLVGSVLLTGCSSNSSSKTVKEDGKYVIASLTDKKILADDVFSNVLETANGKNAYFEAVLQKLMDKKCPVDDAMKTDVKQTISNIEQYYKSQYTDNADAQLEYALSQQGYSSLDEYSELLTRQLQISKFLELYIKDNYDTVFEDYYTQATPRTMSIVYVSVADIENPTDVEKAKLEEVTKLVNSSKDFGEIATDYSDDETSKANNGKVGVVDTSSGMASEFGKDVETKALALQEGEITTEAIKGETGYYFLKCISTNKDTIKKAIKDLGIDSPLIAYDQYLIYLAYNSYELNYSDDEIKEIVTGVVNDSLTKRTEARSEAK